MNEELIDQIIGVGCAMAITLDAHLWERWNLEDEAGQEIKVLIDRWYTLISRKDEVDAST